MKIYNKCDIIDIHSHILYGVDDGADSLETSLLMLKTAYDEGIRTIVATPHYHPGKGVISFDKIRNRFEEFQGKARTVCPKMQLVLGRELLYTSDVLEKLEQGANLTMGGTMYVLIEYDPLVEYAQIRSSLNNILQTGHVPVLAHIERYPCIVDHWERVYELKDMGAVLQVNAGTVIGKHGSKTKKFIKNLLKDELIDVIGTDAHSNGHRAPKIAECAAYLYKKTGESYTNRLLHDNAQAILKGKYLED